MRMFRSKQAVISPSALSLMYPAESLPGYSREEFIKDLLGEHEKEIRGCLAKGAHKVQIDFTEGRLAVKIIRQYLRPGQRIFIGVVSPIDPRIETPEEIRDRVLEAARYIPVEQLGTRTTAVSHHFATTLRARAKRRLRRFAHVWRERCWRKK
jgi:methionine synthase II (cobalamin-independent)